MAARNVSNKPVSREDALRGSLLATVDLLKKCRAAEVADGYLDDYVALQWLEWNAGALRLTVTGQNVCRQLTAGLG
ncbi:MAG: hypothetical protein OEU94_02585 [Aquincola sp.]|nr:hypothetical protein [Aquincola sp.]MDH4290042.1 hypothetical protein [Aquincola sp.]MDH5328689.1 hypothetical protein [Aquincola sp.]